MAEKWERLQGTKDLFPNLKYRTAGDSRVRKDHDKLDGIIKPIDDDFWSRFYPPLDWRCRCDVVATAEDADDKLPEDLPPVKFKGNVGKDKEIFTSKGTFFKLLNTNETAIKNAELSKLNAPFERVYKNKDKSLNVSIYADEMDIESNIKAGQTLVDNGYNIAIRPHLNSMIIPGYKNPEYFINGKIGELKIPKSVNYKNILKKAHKQGCEIVVINLDNNGDTFENALSKVDGILKFNVHRLIKEVVFIKGKKVSIYKRKKQPNK